VNRWSFFYISSLIFTGCSSKSFIALLDNGKESSAIVVENSAGSVVLDKAGSYITLDSRDDIPNSIGYIPPEKLKKRFARLYQEIPKEPRTYIVYFKKNSTELTENSKRVLKEVIEDIKKSSPCIVDIIGHTDTTGSFELNEKLSLSRANYVKDLILQNKNIKISKINVKGYGERRLFVKTSDNVSEAKNRSVEIFIK
jgi:outer membrane protein OmpA-like peptidoglycan-associated protein